MTKLLLNTTFLKKNVIDKLDLSIDSLRQCYSTSCRLNVPDDFEYQNMLKSLAYDINKIKNEISNFKDSMDNNVITYERTEDSFVSTANNLGKNVIKKRTTLMLK